MSAMREALGVLLAGGQGERLWPLTRDRAKPAVPFGAVYRIIDITLSNCLNSRASLADMHGDLANELLAEPGKGKQAADHFNKRRSEAAEDLLAAARNITYAGEVPPVRTVLNELPHYEEFAARARLTARSTQRPVPGSTSGGRRNRSDEAATGDR